MQHILYKKKVIYLKQHIVFTLLLFSMRFYSSAQLSSHTYNDIWSRIFIGDKITEKIKWDFMVQHRRQAVTNKFNLLEKQQLQSYWLWFHYSLPKNFRVSISPFCYFETKHLYNLDERAIKEWRWCARIENQQKIKHFQMLNRLGIEYRYRDLLAENNYSGNFRARYMLRFIIPLVKIKDRLLSFVANDEILLQFGDAVKNSASAFDQNRIYAGFSYEIFKNIKIDLGYCYIYQERPTGKDIDIQNAIWVFITFDNLFSQFKKATTQN